MCGLATLAVAVTAMGLFELLLHERSRFPNSAM